MVRRMSTELFNQRLCCIPFICVCQVKSAAKALKLPPIGNTVAENLSSLVDLATEAVARRFSPLSSVDNIHVIQSIDTLLTEQW